MFIKTIIAIRTLVEQMIFIKILASSMVVTKLWRKQQKEMKQK